MYQTRQLLIYEYYSIHYKCNQAHNGPTKIPIFKFIFLTSFCYFDEFFRTLLFFQLEVLTRTLLINLIICFVCLLSYLQRKSNRIQNLENGINLLSVILLTKLGDHLKLLEQCSSLYRTVFYQFLNLFDFHQSV